MKKLFTLLSMICMGVVLCLTSCDDYYGPPGGPDYSYDKDLIGTWELYSADGVRVTGYQVNWLEFNRGGTGTYYYYRNGKQYSMWLQYDVSFYGNTSQLYIDYQDGSSVSMDYWYNSNATFLYTQWYEGGYRHTYVYQYVNGPDRAPKRSGFEKAAEDAVLPSSAPGLKGFKVGSTN